jgi:cytochrome c biogenesis protein CcmG, thiol:disulfide interchange protein DsbE
VSSGKQWAIVAAVVTLLALALVAVTTLVGSGGEQVGIGRMAPDFRARTLDEPPVVRTLADYRGDVVLLNVWATWCLPCRTEMPSMERLHRAFAGQGLHVVAVSIDKPGFEEEIRTFVKEYALTFDVLYDPDGAITTAYQTTGVPYSFVIDRSGKIRKTVLGAADWSSQGNRSLIASLIAEGT